MAPRVVEVLMHRLALGALWPVSGLRGDLLSARGLNAPFGARCFMTRPATWFASTGTGLNALFGARCFMTDNSGEHILQG